MGIFKLNDRIITPTAWPWGGANLRRLLVEKGACDVSPSPVYSAYTSESGGVPGGHAGGWDLDADTYARYPSDSSNGWVKIDFGAPYYIDSIRFQWGSGTGRVCATLVSLDDVNWTTIANYYGDTYYTSISPWFDVKANVRYIKHTRATYNYIRTYYCGVKTF